MNYQTVPVSAALCVHSTGDESDSRSGSEDCYDCPEVQDPAALLAVDDFLSRFDPRRGRSRYFHVATGANTVLHGDDRSVAFTVEQALELVEQIGVDFRRKRFPLGFEFLPAAIPALLIWFRDRPVAARCCPSLPARFYRPLRVRL